MTMSCSDYLELHKNEIENFIDFQKQIMNLNSSNYHEILNMIINSKYIQEKREFIQLLNSIQVGISIRPLSYELYFSILEQISAQIKQFFSEHELISIFPKKSSILKLYEKSLISLKTISEQCKIQSYNYIYFAPEMKEYNSDLYETNVEDEVKKTLNFDEMKKLRTKGQNSTLIAEYIRNDDCDKFQEYLAKMNLKIDSLLPLSEFEQCRFINQNMNLVDYAAFFGSIKIFKFLILNKCKLTDKTSQFAIAGGNYEIIHILEDKQISFHSCIEISIQFHRNELFDYLVDNHSNHFHMSFNIFCVSVEMYNAEIFYRYIQKMIQNEFDLLNDSILPISAIHGILDLVQFICSIKEFDINKNSYLAFLFICYKLSLLCLWLRNQAILKLLKNYVKLIT